MKQTVKTRSLICTIIQRFPEADCGILVYNPYWYNWRALQLSPWGDVVNLCFSVQNKSFAGALPKGNVFILGQGNRTSFCSHFHCRNKNRTWPCAWNTSHCRAVSHSPSRAPGNVPEEISMVCRLASGQLPSLPEERAQLSLSSSKGPWNEVATGERTIWVYGSLH